MATHASAVKRHKQSEVKRERNRAVMSTMRTSIRKVQEALESKNLEKIDALLRDAQSTIAITRRKGCIHVNHMARRISRLTLAVNKLKASAK